MKPRIDFLTLATSDLDAVRSFYRDGLGWTPLLDVPGEIVFFQAGHGLVLGFFDAVQFSQDLGRGGAATVSGVTLANNVETPEDVRQVAAAAVAAGGTVVKEPQTGAYGGYHAHIADPNGVLWEIATNSGWSVDEDGTVHLGVIEPE